MLETQGGRPWGGGVSVCSLHDLYEKRYTAEGREGTAFIEQGKVGGLTFQRPFIASRLTHSIYSTSEQPY